METSDAVKILFGAGLGLLAGMSKDVVGFYIRRCRAKRLLRITLPAIVHEIGSYRKLESVIPLVAISQLQALNSDHLLYLKFEMAERVTQLTLALNRAESSRKAAADLLTSQDSPMFIAHATAYRSWLERCSDELATLAPLVLPAKR